MKYSWAVVLGIIIGIIFSFIVVISIPLTKRYEVFESKKLDLFFDMIGESVVEYSGDYLVKYDSWNGKVYIFHPLKNVWLELPRSVAPWEERFYSLPDPSQ